MLFLILALLPTILFFIGIGLNNLVVSMLGSVMATAILFLLYMLIPSAFVLLKAKLFKKDLILMFRPDKRIVPMPCELRRGLLYINKHTPFILHSIEDIYFFDGVPTAVAYTLTGRTLSPEMLVQLNLMEEAGLTRQEVVNEPNAIPDGYILTQEEVIPVRGGVNNGGGSGSERESGKE